jgi:serine O-acetyltransferase
MDLDALTLHRLAHALHTRGVPLLPRLLSGFNRLLNKSAIPPDCAIGEETRLGYGGLGLCIDPGSRVGRRSMLCQQVQLRGAVTVGDDVLVGAGAMICGPLRIGDGAQIGANAVVTTDVPAGAVATGIPATVRR